MQIFCRVTGTPEELIVDFGLNKQVGGNTAETIQLNQRIIVNFYTAKRLAAALVMAVQRHEQAFGTARDRCSKTSCAVSTATKRKVIGTVPRSVPAPASG